MSNELAIRPFDANLPVELDERAQAALNQMGNAVSGGAVNRISAKNGNITIQRAGSDAKGAGPEVDVVVVGVGNAVGRVWYAKAWDADSNEKPACFSHDGIAPDPSSPEPQAKYCAGCPKDERGSSKTGGDYKDCSYKLPIAVIAPTELQVLANGEEPEVFQMLVNGSSLFGESNGEKLEFSWRDYANFLTKKRLPPQYVTTTLKYDADSATPSKVLFVPSGFAPDELRESLMDLANSTLVTDLLGLDAEVADGPAKSDEDAAPAPAPAPKPAASRKASSKKKAPPAPAPAPEPAEEEQEAIGWRDYAEANDIDQEDIDMVGKLGGPGTVKGRKVWDNLIGLEIDDDIDVSEPEQAAAEEPEKPAKKAAKKPRKASKKKAPSGVDDEGAATTTAAAPPPADGEGLDQRLSGLKGFEV